MGFFPDDYKPASGDSGGSKSEPNPQYWEFSSKHLGDGDTISFRPCGIFNTGHVVTGYQYFTMEGRVRRFAKYPKDYANDIGLTWAAKNAKPAELEKLEAEGKAKDRPKYFLSFVAYFPDRKDFTCVTATQKGVREQIEAILDMEDYNFLDSGCANFTLTVKRKGPAPKPPGRLRPLSRSLRLPLRASGKRPERYLVAALYEGADPFAGKPAEPKLEGLPPTKRDELGADKGAARHVRRR